MRLAAIIQCRLGSARLPGKVQMDIGGRPMLWHVTKRVGQVIADPVLAWPSEHEDETDVLGRYARIATEMSLDAICRVTGDCPLIDPKPISDVLYLFQTLLYDYVANDIYPTWPDGMGVEVFSRAALDCADREADKPYDREHVTPFMKRDKRNSKRNIRCPTNGLSDLKLSVDTQEDLDFVRKIDAAVPADFSLRATLDAINRAGLGRRNAKDAQ